MQEKVLGLVALFLSSCLYAVVLQTGVGRKLATRRTYVVVVLGVGLVLASLLVILTLEQVGWVALAFAVAGIPMIARSLMNELADEDKAKDVR